MVGSNGAGADPNKTVEEVGIPEERKKKVRDQVTPENIYYHNNMKICIFNNKNLRGQFKGPRSELFVCVPDWLARGNETKNCKHRLIRNFVRMSEQFSKSLYKIVASTSK